MDAAGEVAVAARLRYVRMMKCSPRQASTYWSRWYGMGGKRNRGLEKEPEEDSERTVLWDEERAPHHALHLLNYSLSHSRPLPNPWLLFWRPGRDDLELRITITQGWKDNGCSKIQEWLLLCAGSKSR